MFNPFSWLKRKEQQVETSVALSVVRSALKVLGGALVGQGWLTDDQLTEAVGALITLAGIGWSAVIARNKTKQLTEPDTSAKLPSS